MDHPLEASSATLHYTDTGEGPATLIFLHYWGGSARTWQQVINRLAPRVRCVALSQRGWGGSLALDARYRLEAMADDVAALIAALQPGPFVLVGHSMGGKVSQIVAKRGLAGLTGLLLVAPAPPTPTDVPPEQREAMLSSYQTCQGVINQALPNLGGSALPEALREKVIADTLTGHPDAKKAWPRSGMVEDITAGLDQVTVPVSTVVGDRDQVERVDKRQAEFPPVLPQVRFTIFNGIAHLSPLQAPDAIADASSAVRRTVGLT